MEPYYDEIDREFPEINVNAEIENGNVVRERIIEAYFQNNR